VDFFYNLDKNKLYLKNFDIMTLKSISPTSILLPSNSFNFQIGVKTSNRIESNKVNFISELGIGKAFTLFNKLIKPYLMLCIFYE
jgi:hypothetical protein